MAERAREIERLAGLNTVRALARTIRKALVLYDSKDLLAHCRRNTRRADFSSDRTAAD